MKIYDFKRTFVDNNYYEISYEIIFKTKYYLKKRRHFFILNGELLYYYNEPHKRFDGN